MPITPTMRQPSAAFPVSGVKSVTLLGYPNECPRCHVRMSPKYIGTFTRDISSPEVEESFQCTNEHCGRLFIAVYRGPSSPAGAPSTLNFGRSIPDEPSPPRVSEEIVNVSPTFVEVFTQALAAEAQGLHQLTGIGLRKALEFLVKDFAKSQKPTEAEEILKKPARAVHQRLSR